MSKLTSSQLLDEVGKRKYRAKIDKIYPSENRFGFKSKKAFLGISLENQNFKPSKLNAILKWASNNYECIGILVGDGIHRLNLMENLKLSEEEANAVSISMGNQFLNENTSIINHYFSNKNLEIIRCSDIQKENKYMDFHIKLNSLFLQNNEFRCSINDFSSRYLKRRMTTIPPSVMERSAKYFLEEFAIFCCLVEQGYEVMLYPGSFSTLAEIAEGYHDEAPVELKNLTSVSLAIKGV